MSQKCYVLLVGINEYHPQSVRVNTLKACLNDVEAMQNLLEKQYAIPITHIRTLLNEQATRKNIIQNFREHLTANADENTSILFYYSGHGSRQSLPKAFQKYVAGTSREYRREETLVCYDSRAYIDNRWIEKDLADKELAILIKEVAQKNAHIVIILDCCHSGSGTRSKSESKPSDAQKREVKERIVEDALHRNYLDNYYEKMLEEKGEITLPNSAHILLAGTQKDRVSWETEINGERRGVFTYYLEQALLANSHLTYADLFSLVHPQVKNFTKDLSTIQNPQFETYNFFNAHSSFLTGATVPENRRLYSLKMVRGEWQIEQGEIHGLAPSGTNPKIEWVIYKNPKDDESIASVRTTRIGMDYNVVEIVKGTLNSAQNYLAELRTLSTQPCTIGINVNPPSNEVGSPLFQLVNNDNLKEQVIINKEQGQYTFAREGNVIVTEKYDSDVLSSKLTRVAYWNKILESHNTHPKLLNYEDFPLTFRVVGEQASMIVLNDGKGFIELESERGKYFPDDENAWAIPYEIRAQNHSEYDVYFTLLHLDPFYGIEVYYNDKVPAQTREVLLAEGYGLFPEALLNPTIDRFKLIVSTRELHSYLFTQKDIREKFKKPTKRTNQTIPEDWLAKVLEVQTIKK